MKKEIKNFMFGKPCRIVVIRCILCNSLQLLALVDSNRNYRGASKSLGGIFFVKLKKEAITFRSQGLFHPKIN